MSGGYQHHELIERPTSDAVIWRFMDLPKFLGLVARDELHLSRVDQFRDKWEGFVPERMRELHLQGIGVPVTDALRAEYETHLAGYRTRVFANCWYRAPHESAAMWTGYAAGGVAIRSTFAQLERALPSTHQHAIYAGSVRYIDYQRDSIPLGNGWAPFMHKRLEFRDEREVRVVVNTHSKELPASLGFPLKIDLGELVSAVHVAPTPDWLASVLRAALKRMGLAFELESSPLWAPPR